MKRALVLLIFCSLIVSALPQSQGFVNDFANILSSEDELRLSSLIDSIEKNTSVEIAIVIIPELTDKSIEEEGLAYLEGWGVGKKDKDNGIVIVIAPNDRKYRIETGYGMEGIIPDSISGRLGRDILVPAFREEKYGEGLYQLVLAIQGFVGDDPAIVEKYSLEEGTFAADTILIFFGVVAFLMLVGYTDGIKKKWLRWTVFGTSNTLLALLILLFAFAIASFIFGIFGFILLVFGPVIFYFLSKSPGNFGKGNNGGGFIWFGGPGGGFGGSGGGFGGGSGGGGGSSGGW
ncbi:hypothetical protein COV18_04685 [Candidatus Woesearchaeota archaeon CG10_big_fil_rev_8_21_14_0_10_37_12]|nr:MAG: hypothetical protein COV18_04685 [Candidatus Woesearchaeota archaeon CG10_big_fil_rev_8_21_14_0_10_37_12]